MARRCSTSCLSVCLIPKSSTTRVKDQQIATESAHSHCSAHLLVLVQTSAQRNTLSQQHTDERSLRHMLAAIVCVTGSSENASCVLCGGSWWLHASTGGILKGVGCATPLWLKVIQEYFIDDCNRNSSNNPDTPIDIKKARQDLGGAGRIFTNDST